MMKLYYAPGACSFVPHALLETTGAAFEPTLVKLHKGEQQSAEYRAINPRGQVPVLVDDGRVVTQIVAIVLHLDARLPDAQLLPRETFARSKVLETLMWMNNTFHPTFTHVFMPGKFTDSPDAQAQVKAFASRQYGVLLGELEDMVQALPSRGDAFLGGERFGPLDAYSLTLLRWGGFAGHDPAGFPALWAHVQRIAQLPAVARVIERERLQLNVYPPA